MAEVRRGEPDEAFPEEERQPLVANDTKAAGSNAADEKITTQHLVVFFVAYMGWTLDIFDATLFTIIQTPALEDLLNTESKSEISSKAGIILSCFLIGAAIGGIVFGMLADHFGRAKMMIVTVLIYSLGTTACAFVATWWQLLILRVITGLGTGGEWACGAALVSEVWPDKYRHVVAPLLQSGAGAGFLLAGIGHMAVSPYGWRMVFLLGLIPALLSISIRFFVDESAMWRDAQRKKQEAGIDAYQSNSDSMKMIFSDKYRQDTISLTVCMMMINFVYWSAGAWVPSIVRDLKHDFPEQNKNWNEDEAATAAVVMMNIGAIAGAVSWIWTADRFGRKPVFVMFLAGQLTFIPIVFAFVHPITQFILLVPFVGFLISGIYGGMPLYLPEIFPTAIRATGSSFVFNVGRIFAAVGTMTMGTLVGAVGNYYESAAIIPLFSIVTMIAFQFPRETRGTKLE